MYPQLPPLPINLCGSSFERREKIKKMAWASQNSVQIKIYIFFGLFHFDFWNVTKKCILYYLKTLWLYLNKFVCDSSVSQLAKKIHFKKHCSSFPEIWSYRQCQRRPLWFMNHICLNSNYTIHAFLSSLSMYGDIEGAMSTWDETLTT